MNNPSQPASRGGNRRGVGSSRVGSQFGKVAVVMGGWSAEREVSLMSGRCVLDGLLSAGIDAHDVDADTNLVAELNAREFDRVFLILHGRGGEDGQVQGALDMAGLPYTGSGVLASALCMDKHRAKLLALAAGVKTPLAFCVNTLEEASNAVASIGLPVVIKPTMEGSSIGVSLVHTVDEVAQAYTKAAEYGPVLIEQMMTGMEVTAAIVQDTALPLVSMQAKSSFYDYHAKYFAEDTRYDCPPQLDEATQKRIQQDALTVFQALGCRHWGRVDFMLDAAGEPHFIECNTAPGMTTHSLVPMAANEAGVSFSELVVSILSATLSTVEAAS